MHISLDSAIGQQRRLNQVGETINSIAAPAAAYSLRSLTGGDPKVVRVRRESDNTERDFTASDVNSGALVDFVNTQTVKPLDTRALNSGGSGERDGDFQIASAAYSLRSLGDRQATVAATGDTVTAANGKYVVQVRRSSDDTIKSFTADEVTDGTLVAFVGSGNDGFVRTWYDQSVTDQGGGTATGNHATQTTAAEQPKIVSSGSLVSNGIDFASGSSATLDMPTDLISSTNSASAFLVAKSDTTGGSRIGLALSRNSPDFRFYLPFLSSSNFNFGYQDSATKISLGSADTNKHLFTAIAGSSNAEAFLDSTSKGTVSSADGKSALSSGGIGTINDGSHWNGQIEEILVYASDQTDNRGAYEGNIADHYGITGVPTGANTVNGFVETWYDQSGNGNNATQTTADNQPKIVNSGVLLTKGVTFDGTNDSLALTSTLGQTNLGSSFSVVELDSTTSTKTIIDNRDSGSDGFVLFHKDDAFQFKFASTTETVSSDSTSQLIVSAFKTSSNQGVGINGGTLEETSNTSTINVSSVPVIGSRSFSGSSNISWDGEIAELILYNSDQSSNRTAIETNINSHYSLF